VANLNLAQKTPELLQNYPNPFMDGTSIEFKLSKPGKYVLTILDVNGRVIRILNDDDQLSVDHTIYWDGRDNSGKNVNSGVYVYRLEGSGFSQMKRMVKM
jgi:flagellar hook assembly protein FlgD